MQDWPDRTLDVSRILARVSQPAPTGIDRVELAYAQYYLRRHREGAVRFFVSTPFYGCRLNALLVRHLVRVGRERWSSSEVSGSDDAFGDLVRELASPITIRPHSNRTRAFESRAGMLDVSAANLSFAGYYQAFLTSLWHVAKRSGSVPGRS